jgi:cytochrome c peroxidase
MDQTCIGFTSGNLAFASWHLPDQGWTTNSPLSPAYPMHMERRNSQTLINVAYNKALIWVGRAGVLEEQVLGPIQNPLHILSLAQGKF